MIGWGLCILLILVFLASVGLGAVHISPMQVVAILADKMHIRLSSTYTEVQASVLLAIRLPRVLLAVLVGASLSVAGASMQALFRNPLADPGLIGISSGASLAAVAAIVLGFQSISILGTYSLSIITFLGALLTAVLVYRISRSAGKVVVATMLLAGVAINAMAGAGTGLLTYIADDAQLRSITFWMLGSLGGATWNHVLGILPFTLLPVLLLPAMGKALNAFALGESNAMYLGVSTERVKRVVILLSALCVGASVAVSGVIGFIGLVVPHILRLSIGPDNRVLLVLTPVLGALLLVSADLVARTVFVPAEVPIGILTSLIGAPVFLYIVVKELNLQKQS